jgi:hypothetical protein
MWRGGGRRNSDVSGHPHRICEVRSNVGANGLAPYAVEGGVVLIYLRLDPTPTLPPDKIIPGQALLHAGEGDQALAPPPVQTGGGWEGVRLFGRLYICVGLTPPRPSPRTKSFRGRLCVQGREKACPSGEFQKPLAFFAQKKLEKSQKKWLALLKYFFATPKKFVRRMA